MRDQQKEHVRILWDRSNNDKDAVLRSEKELWVMKKSIGMKKKIWDHTNGTGNTQISNLTKKSATLFSMFFN